MIEPDINERMSRFAPSQQQPDVDPVAADIAARAMIPSSQPTMGEMPEVDSVARAIAERSRENLNAAVLGARTVNPDEAAKAIGLSRKIGIPPEVARADIGRAEQQAYLMDLRSKDFERTDPIMANFLSQKEFAEVAHDDISVLDSIRPIMQDWAMLYWTGATPGMRRGFERGQLVAERGDIGAKAMTGFASPEDFDRAKQVELRLRELTDTGFLGATTEVIAQNLAQLRGIGTATVGGAAIGSVVPVIGTISGAGLGATAGVMATTAQMEAGNLYLDLREQGVSDDTAIPVALAGGYINGVIEVVGMKVAAKPFQALAKRMISQSIAKAVAQPTMRAALATAGKSYLLQVGAEGTEESLQEIVIIAGEEIAEAIDGIDTEVSMAQAMDRVVDAFTQGAMGAAILGGIGPGANLYVDMRRAATTQRQQDFFQRLSETSKESRLAQRSPDAYERFLEAQAKGGPAETIYVDARVAQQVFAQSGLTPQQLEEVLPGIRAQVETEVATGGDVTIQTARFGARLANTDLGNALLPHMRLDPDAMSVTEAQEWNVKRQETVREAEQILAQKQEADGAFVAEARDIYNDVRRQAMEAGQDSDVADVAASLYQAFVVTQAAEQNMTPAQFQAAQGVRGIQGIIGEMAPAVAPLEQANRDLIASVDAELGGIMDAAKEASRAAGKTRSKETQAAAFKAKQDWIAANPARYAEYQAAQRTDALENERVREAAASALAGKIDESLATAAKTLTDAGFVLDYESPAPSKSRYYRKGNTLIRLSDHEIPVTQERAAAREAGVQVPYRDFVFDGTAVDAELIQDLEAFAARTAPGIMEQAVLNEQTQRWLQSDVMIRPTDPRWAAARPFGQFPTLTAEGRPRFEGEVTQASLAEIVPEGRTVFHETNLNGAKALISRILEGPRRHAPFFVSDNIDLAIGQAGRGYIIELDPQFSNGQQVDIAERKPGLAMTEAAGAGTELRIDKTLRQSLRSVIVPNQRGLDALRQVPGLPERLDFDNPIQTERGLQINRKVAAAPGVMEQAAVQRGEQATLERLQMQAQRGVRRQARKVELSPTEEAAIATAASEFGESAAEIREAVLNHKKAHPTTQGWAPLEFVKLAPKKIEDKGKKGLGLEKLDLQYQQIPYGFHRDANGKPLQPATPEYQAAVASVARRMVDEVRAVAARAAAGDQNAVRIINQSTWYKAMRTALRREFGGLGDLFADLLGATSPNTPVRGNWDFALDVLRRAARGDFDAIITKWEAWVETIERLETDLRAYINDEQRAMEARGEKVSQAAIQRKPEYIEKFKALKEARNLPDELLPRQENGKKYGFNGGNVVRAMVGLWRTVREQNTLLGTTAQAPKALNFSGNLIGFRARATIDVWAARMLQRLAALLRIPSMAETGVAGEMLPDGSTTGQFGFGQDVFAEAAQRIRNDAELNQNPQLAQLNDDDLQALVWFIEKELWTINNWTSVAGEGGSFELEASLAGISDREMVTQLRKTIDAGVPTKIREAASRLPAAQQAKLNWYLDPAKAGWRQRIDAIRAELDAVPTTLTKKAQRELREEISKRLDAALQKSGFTKLEQALNDAITADMKLAAIEEARKAAQAKLIAMERRVDRYTAGLSQQQSLDSQGVDYVPTDADQARLADNVRLRAYRADPGNLLVAIKSMSTEGRYGSIERSIDLEVIARQGWNPSELWQVMLEEARDARQESTFLSRVLRADEAIDPARHRPGLEIYFRSPIPRDKLDALIEKLNANGVDFFTVIVDARRSTAARSGAMADAVGIRMQYVPEFMQRYGIEDFSGLSEAEIADRVKAKEAEWLLLADQVLRVMPEVSFAGVFWHETRVAFADAYESEIDAITTGTATGDGGQPAGTQWAGQSVSEGLAAANRFVESRATQAEPDGGGQVLGGVQEGDRVGFAEPGVGTVFEQAAAAPGPRGGIDIRRMVIMLTKASDRTTLWHEFVHFFLHMYTEAAVAGRASERQLNDLDLLLKWFKIDGETPAERLAKWSAMTLDQKRKHHEALTYNAEIYAFEGKAPSAELIPVFERLRAFMLRVYKSIRDDLNAIYRREFGEDLPILTGEVRQVMDRMLATDEQIRRQAAINEMKPMFQSQEQSGMDDAEWAAYQAMQQEAIEAAVTDMNKASLRQMQWLGNARSRILKDIQRKHDRQRKEVAAEVAAELRVEPVYRAMTYLRYGKFIDADGNEIETEGPHKLDSALVKQMYALETFAVKPQLESFGVTAEPGQVGFAVAKDVDTEFLKRLSEAASGKNAIIGKDGLYPDAIAETFGFGSGDQMIRALLAAKPMKEAVAERTDAEMLRRFGDMNTPEAQEAEVQKALHNEARARFVAVELRYVARATEPVRVMLDAAKQVARDLIAGRRVRDVRPSDFVAAEARAARDATRIGTPTNPVAIGQAAQTRAYNEAIAAGTDPAEAMVAAIEAGAEAARMAQERSDALKAQYGAEPQQALIRAKRAQLYQNQLAAEALRVQEEVAKAVKYLRRVLRDENVKRMGAPAADQIAGLLERYEVAPVSLKRLDERRALVEWMAAQEAAGLVPDIAPEIANEARRINYREIKVSEFRDLVDAVKQIEFIGKNERKLQLAEERAAFEETRDEIVTRIRAVAKVRGLDVDPRSPLTNIGRTAAALRGFAAQHLKAASVARILDGGKDDGPLWNAIIRTANAAADMETTMRAEASAKLAEILGPVFKLGNMGGKGIYFPSIDRALNREARIAIALNVGNDGNRQRLLDGEGWTMEQIQPVLESLTEAEWQAVQRVWDYIDTYRPLIAEKERRLYGKTPEWVEAVPMTVRTADGKVVNLTGGYYPIKYDPVASDRVATIDEVAEAKRAMDGAYTAATTRRSFVKARAKEVVDRPLLYTLDAAFSGVNDVIHDLAWHEWLIGTNRLLRDTEFANAVRETRGPEFLKQLRDWAKDNAAGERKQQVAGEGPLSWLRKGISASGLGFNVVSAVMQVTGFNQSIVRVGAKYVGRGIAQFAGAPIATARMVAEKSQFMAERGRTQFRELNEIRNRVRGQTEVARRVTAGTYFLMMNMQRTVDVPTWLGAYQKALDAGKTDAKAVALADQAVRETQGSGLISDLAAIERGGPMMKLFTVFYSYMNTVYNMTAVQTYTARGRGKLAADYVMLLVVPVVLGQAIKNLVQPDADDEEFDPEALARKLAAEELSFLMGTMVIAREFGGAAQILTGADGVRMGYGGPAGLRAAGEIYGLATQAEQLEFDRAFRRSAINTLGALTGLPSAQVNRTIDGIEAVIEGEVTGVGAVAAPFTGVQR